jgi:hypothetical protein
MSTAWTVTGTVWVVSSLNGFRSFLYRVGRLLGDINAVKRGRVGRRIGLRIAGKLTGRGLGRLFK